ncbi:MAG: adenosine kinase [Salinivirgaceae bacterium]|nr:adenosine kinase [Salinivirgaceae bacterium]
MKKILGMGNALVDIMTTLPDDGVLAEFNLPKGSMQLVDSELCDRIYKRIEQYNPKISAGGSAANTIHGLARLGAKCGFIGKTSRDKLGTLFRQDLADSGVEPHILDSQSATGHAIALVTPDSERTFATHLGAAVELTAAELDAKVFAQYDFFYIEGYLVQNHDLIETAIKIARSQNMKVAIDLASYNVVAENLDFLRRISKEYVDIIFANEEEAKAFTGKEAEAAADELAAMCDIAVVKVGKRGSIIRQGDKEYRTGIIEANCIDTTGAGDYYAAGFMFGLASDYSLDRCGRLGALLSGKVIESLGAQISPENWAFIDNEIKKI